MSDEDGPAPTPRYRRMLENSVGVAREMGNSYVGVEHLFLAIIRDRDSVPTQALARLIDLGQLEAGLLGEIASPSYAGQAPANAVWFPSSELQERLSAVPPGTWHGWNAAGDQAWIAVDESP